MLALSNNLPLDYTAWEKTHKEMAEALLICSESKRITVTYERASQSVSTNSGIGKRSVKRMWVSTEENVRTVENMLKDGILFQNKGKDICDILRSARKELSDYAVQHGYSQSATPGFSDLLRGMAYPRSASQLSSPSSDSHDSDPGGLSAAVAFFMVSLAAQSGQH